MPEWHRRRNSMYSKAVTESYHPDKPSGWVISPLIITVK